MSIIVVGVNHRSAPLAVLERLAIAPDEQAKAVTGLVQRDNIREVALLSTCGRTEIYLVAERFHGAYADATEFLADIGSLAVDDLSPYLFTQHEDGAATHLFEVAAGLDSAVIGESEILGQVRSAWKVAQGNGGVRSTLDLLFRRALRVGKRARTETAIGRGTASISHAAVEMATERLGSLDGRRVLVVGAGEMGRGVATALHHAGAGSIVVANRTPSRGAALAERVGGTLIGFDGLDDAFASADVAVTCASGDTIVTPELLARRTDAPARPLLVVDIAVPRNVDHAVSTLDGVTLLDLDDLRDWAQRGLQTRAADADRVRGIVADELEQFLVESTARLAAPLVARLHERAEQIREAELRRYANRLGDLDEAGRAAVDALTKAIVAKLLHSPSVRLRNDAGTPQGQRNAAAVSDLFELE
ncbi:glutamyl-tRNA reductase [Desertimonas flava]|jgi:glutamyl-tRNA reductase|uniref:glutamyl-tRNA reductase n=1 Tax=Desertimonas flava TaxID=2064846 RepID=UPI000E347908|nr:glutamyl-tRNA reductase [Desertimonas flava]